MNKMEHDDNELLSSIFDNYDLGEDSFSLDGNTYAKNIGNPPTTVQSSQAQPQLLQSQSLQYHLHQQSQIQQLHHQQSLQSQSLQHHLPQQSQIQQQHHSQSLQSQSLQHHLQQQSQIQQQHQYQYQQQHQQSKFEQQQQKSNQQHLYQQAAGIPLMHFWPSHTGLENSLSRYDPNFTKGSMESLSTLETGDEDCSPIYKRRKSRKKERSMSIGSQGDRRGLASNDSNDSLVSLDIDGYGYGNTEDKKRQDRNTREKQRSFKISKQIEQLKVILEKSGVKVKSSKYDVLSSATEYLRQLQTQSNKMIKSLKKVQVKCESLEELTSSKSSRSHAGVGASQPLLKSSNSLNQHSQNITDTSSNIQQSILLQNDPLNKPADDVSAAIALGTLDGRIFDCSDSLSAAVGISKESLLNCTMFKLTHPAALHNLYTKMGNMLNSTTVNESDMIVVKSIFTDTQGNDLYITISLLVENLEPTDNQSDQKTIKYFLLLFSRLL